MARVSVREQIAPYIEQGLSVKEISEITGYCYNTVRYAVFPEKRSGKKKVVSDNTDSPKSWCIECDKDIEWGTGRIEVDVLFGETWFLSKAEAEKALAEMEK